MGQFSIQYTCKSTKKETLTTDEGKIELPYWDDKSRTLIIGDTEEVTFSILPTSLTDIEGNQLVKEFKFDLFNVETKHNYGFIDVDEKGNEIPGTSKEHISYGNPFTLKGRPGYKGSIFWAEYFKDKSHFEETEGKPVTTHPLGMFVVFQRPDPIIESVKWLDPKTEDEIKEKNLGQYVIVRIKTKHLEGETINISLWEYDNSINAKVLEPRGSIDYWAPAHRRFDNLRMVTVSKEHENTETGEKWEGTVKSMDLGFSISHDVMKEKLNADGSLDILVHLNPAWIQDREGKQSMDNWNEFWELELCVKIEHPRLPNYVEEGAKDKETGKSAYGGATLGLFYGKFLNVKKEVKNEPIPLKASKMVAAIVQNDTQMEAKGTEPCKFTYIAVTEQSKDPIVLFKEADMVSTQLHDFKLLIGDKEKGKKTITINLDDPKETDPNKKTIVCPNVKALDLNNTHKDNTFNTEKIDTKFIKTQADNQLVLEVYTESPDIPTALKNTWLPNIEPISLKVLAQTCRYQRWVNIQGYPDLQYELSFKSSSEANLYEFESKNFVVRDYKGNMGLLSKKEKKKQKKKKKALLKQRKQDAKNHNVSDAFVYNNFQICFEYALAGSKLKEVAIDGEHPVFDAIDTLMYISNMIGKLCFVKEVEQAEKEHDDDKVKARKKKRNKHLKEINKKSEELQKKIKKKSKKLGKKIDKYAPFSITVAPPTFAGSVAWQLAPSQTQGLQHELGTQFTIKAKADPLIEIEGRLDLLFILTKVPYVGQAVRAITTVADGADGADDVWNWLVDVFKGDDNLKIDIDVDYHLDLVATGNFKIEAEAVQYHTLDGWGTGEVKPFAEFIFGIEAGLKIQAKVGRFDSLTEFYGKGYAKWIVQKSTNKDGEKVWQVEYAGLYAVFYANVNFADAEDTKGKKKKKKSKKPSAKEEPKKLLIHKGFTYETKID